jgi:3-hydroxyacyl-CoA dehydrogenase / 3-hydroxy-2-methylbutyryl-CoA dehydrogenase
LNVEGAVGVVTGGASGLGEATVRMLVEGGGRAVILDLEGSPGAALAEELGDAVRFVAADITVPAQVEGGVATAADAFGRIDLCVSCAGVSPAARVVARDGTLFPLEVFQVAVNVNLIGLFDVTRHAAARMAANEPAADGERGLIVNVGSIAGIEGQVGQAAYAASKGGVLALTLPLARDLAPLGIRVMAVAPGIMDTPMLAGVSEDRRQALADIHVFPKRLGTPADFARLVRSLMENTMLNGEIVRLDAATRLGVK